MIHQKFQILSLEFQPNQFGKHKTISGETSVAPIKGLVHFHTGWSQESLVQRNPKGCPGHSFAVFSVWGPGVIWLSYRNGIWKMKPQFDPETGPRQLPQSSRFYHLISCCSVTQPCLTVCDPMACSMSGFPDIHHLLKFAQTHIHWVSEAIQPSCPLLSPSPPAFSLSQHQGLF